MGLGLVLAVLPAAAVAQSVQFEGILTAKECHTLAAGDGLIFGGLADL